MLSGEALRMGLLVTSSYLVVNCLVTLVPRSGYLNYIGCDPKAQTKTQGAESFVDKSEGETLASFTCCELTSCYPI